MYNYDIVVLEVLTKGEPLDYLVISVEPKQPLSTTSSSSPPLLLPPVVSTPQPSTVP
jgi:hypothetical protein